MTRLARVVGKAEKKSAKAWLVPAVIAMFAVVVGVLVWAFRPSTAQFDWHPYLRPDADYSIDMPGTAQIRVQQEQTQYGPTTVQTLQCQTSNPAAMFSVQYSPFPANSPFLKMTAAQADAALQQYVNRLTEQLEGKILDQKAYQHPAGFGRSFRIQLSGNRQYHGRILYFGPGQYQLSVIAPEEAEVPSYVKKFLNSFEYRGTPREASK